MSYQPVIPPDEGRWIAYRACVDQLMQRGKTQDDAERMAMDLIGRWLEGKAEV